MPIPANRATRSASAGVTGPHPCRRRGTRRTRCVVVATGCRVAGGAGTPRHQVALGVVEGERGRQGGAPVEGRGRPRSQHDPGRKSTDPADQCRVIARHRRRRAVCGQTTSISGRILELTLGKRGLSRPAVCANVLCARGRSRLALARLELDSNVGLAHPRHLELELRDAWRWRG